MRILLGEGQRMTKRIAELLPKCVICTRVMSAVVLTVFHPIRAPRIPLHEVRLRAPISDPSKILCIGLNYRDHATESKMQLPKGTPLCTLFI